MRKYWEKQIFSLGRFPEVGQKQKTERETKRKKERLNNGKNNGQLRIANATSGGARKADWAKISYLLVEQDREGGEAPIMVNQPSVGTSKNCREAPIILVLF